MGLRDILGKIGLLPACPEPSATVDPVTGGRDLEAALHFNGIDAATGRPLFPPLSPRELGRWVAMPLRTEAERDALFALAKRTEAGSLKHLPHSIEPGDLTRTGWGMVLPSGADSEGLRRALEPLLAFRESQVGGAGALFTILDGGQGVGPGEDAQAFRSRHRLGPDEFDPERLPHYLLLVGRPDEIPFSFQHGLTGEHAVGRLAFDTVEEYASYACSVVETEAGPLRRPRRLGLWAPVNAGDPLTPYSSEMLARPLAEALRAERPDWTVEEALGGAATRRRLSQWINEPAPPTLLLTASHGAGLGPDDAAQREINGSLVTQEWSAGEGPLRPDQLFAAADVEAQADLRGRMLFHFACFGGGTPDRPDFPDPEHSYSAAGGKAFVSRLPQRLLGHPEGGVSAVVAHVERAWAYSFAWPEVGGQISHFQRALRRLMEGQPVGWAMDVFARRSAVLLKQVAEAIHQERLGIPRDPEWMARQWTAGMDARNYAILGDPAARLRVEADPANDADEERG